MATACDTLVARFLIYFPIAQSDLHLLYMYMFVKSGITHHVYNVPSFLQNSLIVKPDILIEKRFVIEVVVQSLRQGKFCHCESEAVIVFMTR